MIIKFIVVFLWSILDINFVFFFFVEAKRLVVLVCMVFYSVKFVFVGNISIINERLAFVLGMVWFYWKVRFILYFKVYKLFRFFNFFDFIEI